MIFSLFFKECKIHLKSILFYVYVLLFAAFFMTQFSDFPMLTKPEKTDQSFGMTVSSDTQVIMNMTMEKLLGEYRVNRYTVYPVGFYKEVTLNETKQNEVCKIIEKVTGVSFAEAEHVYLDYWSKSPKPGDTYEEDWERQEKFMRENPFEIPFAEGMTYELFEENMEKINKILGGGSYYAKDRLAVNAYIPMTYEQAEEEYESVIHDDKVTGAYARLFCDYMGLMLAILPVFLAVSRELRDKKAKAVEVIYSKKISSLRLLGSKYLALLVVSVLPVLIFGIILLSHALFLADSLGIKGDIILYFEYLCVWLLPTAMFTISVGMLCSVLTGKVLGVLLQGIIWFLSVFSGDTRQAGGWNLIPRFNSFGEHEAFVKMSESFAMNRILYTVLAVILFFAAVVIFEQKRRGGSIWPWKRICK